MHSGFTAAVTLPLSRISAFALMVIVIGISACGTFDTDTFAELSESGSPGQASDDNPNLKLEPNRVLTQAPLPYRPPIGTEIGKPLPQFEITLFGGEKKSTASLANIGQPVFLFFFTTW